MAGAPKILAVVVLYRRSAEQSESVMSLRSLIAGSVACWEALELTICDNSPYPQAPPAGFDGLYVQDLANPGLAQRYNEALRWAEKRGAAWLMLLDQDTTVTEGYLREVVERAAAPETGSFVAMVPKLVEAGVVCSPAYPPTYGPARAIELDFCGAARQNLQIFNSGAVVRVSALRTMGGFPERYPLDYLDHATFRTLQPQGELLVLREALEHQLSSNDSGRTDADFAERQERVLDAEYRFYAEYGSAKEQVLRRTRLVRAALGRVVRRKHVGQTWRMLKSALRP